MPAPGGVNSNLFALLDDDDNDEDAAPVQKAPAAKPAAKKHEEQPKKAEPRERKGKGGDDRRPRGGKGDRNDAPSGTYDGSDKPNKPSAGEGRGKGNRRRYDEGGERKGKGKGERRGREFDRHVSGTGRGKGEQAREGRGRGNWGQAGDQGTTEAPAEGAATEETTGETAVAPVVEEEEENTMTMDEYMASLSGKAPVGGKLEERRIDDSGEGFKVERDNEADAGGSDDMYGMIFHAYDGQHKNKGEKAEREGWVTADDVLNMKFVDPNAGQMQGGGGKGGDRDRRGGKGGKKGGSKGGDRGGARQGGAARQARPVQEQGKIELEDTNAFPSLA